MKEDHPIVVRVRQRLRWHVTQPFERGVRAPLRRLRNAGREFRPIFVAGVAGSGTSLVAVALAQRFDCAGIAYESAHEVAKSSFLHGPMQGFDTVQEYLDGITPRDSWSVEAGRRDLQELYRACCSGPAEWVCDKGPNVNLVRAGFLARCFPDAPFVLVFRNPLANVEGFRRKWSLFGDAPLAESIRFYRETYEAFLRQAASFPERVVAVEYEEFVEQPDARLQAIGARLRLPAARRALRIPSRPNVEGRGVRNVKRNRVGFVAGTTDRALARLDAAQAEEIRAALGPLHERLRSLPCKV